MPKVLTFLITAFHKHGIGTGHVDGRIAKGRRTECPEHRLQRTLVAVPRLAGSLPAILLDRQGRRSLQQTLPLQRRFIADIRVRCVYVTEFMDRQTQRRAWLYSTREAQAGFAPRSRR